MVVTPRECTNYSIFYSVDYDVVPLLDKSGNVVYACIYGVYDEKGDPVLVKGAIRAPDLITVNGEPVLDGDGFALTRQMAQYTQSIKLSLVYVGYGLQR